MIAGFGRSIAGRLSVAGAMVIALLLAMLVPQADAATCTRGTVNVGIVEAVGCYTTTSSGTQIDSYRFTEPMRLNGWDVTVDRDAAVVVTTAAGKRTATLSTEGMGGVTLSAANASYGRVAFTKMRFSSPIPNSGDLVLSQNEVSQPAPLISGLTPVSVEQPIVLNQGGSTYELTFSAGGLFGRWLAKSEKEIAVTFVIGVRDGAYTLVGGRASIKNFTLAGLLKINEAILAILPASTQVDIDAKLAIPKSELGVAGGLQFNKGQSFPARLSFALTGINKPIGTTGIYLQKLGGEVVSTPYLGGKGLVALSAGPEVKFLGRDVKTMELDSAIELQSGEYGTNKPGLFRVTGKGSLFGLQVADVDFTYRFGVGTDFGLSLGIGLPSGRNNPADSTYIGGRFRGSTWATGFNLQAEATIKILGVSLAGAKVVVSDYGAGACLRLGLWLGGGVRWSDGKANGFVGWSCSLGQYERQRPAQQFSRPGEQAMSVVALDQGDRVVRLDAPDGEEAPRVTLLGEDGESVRAPSPDDADGIARRSDGTAVSDDDGSTFFVLPRGSEGTWSIKELAGSSPVQDMFVAGRAPDPDVSASVEGDGGDRTLQWTSAGNPYQTLLFSERLRSGKTVPILQTDAANGTTTFRPARGLRTYGERDLVVDVLQRYDTPRDRLIADQYTVSAPPLAEKVRKVTVRRDLNDLIVTWARSSGAATYRVIARPVGADVVYTADAGRGQRRVTLDSVGVTKKLRVSVVPLNADGQRGPSGKVVMDTDDVVPSLRAAATMAAGSVRTAGRRGLAADLQCPSGDSCAVTVTVRGKSRTLARATEIVAADMSQRLKLELPGPVASLGNPRVSVRVQQGAQSARAGKTLSGGVAGRG